MEVGIQVEALASDRERRCPQPRGPGRSSAQLGHRLVELIAQLPSRRERHRRRPFVIRAIVAAGGFALLIGGLAMLVLPGPGALAVAFGLATLALEFGWADRLLRRTAGLTAVTMCRSGPGRALLLAAGATATVAAALALIALR
jgi:hypothetical protein